MYLSEYFTNLYQKFIDHYVSNITINSKKVKDGSIFILRNNIQYLDEALNKGAKTIIYDNKNIGFSKRDNINYFYVIDVIDTYGKLLKIYYLNFKKNVNNKPVLIGITGTAGKTTTSTLLYRTLKKGNKNVCLIGTNGNYLYSNKNETYYKTDNTTPDLEIIYEYMFEKADNLEYLIMEVSSQGIDFGRILGLEFDICCFLNISNEHLDHHLTIENYCNSKLKLFNQLKEEGIAIVNCDSPFSGKFIKNNKIVYGFGSKKCEQEKLSKQFIFSIKKSTIKTLEIMINDNIIISNLTGDYNAYNICAIYTILNGLNDLKNAEVLYLEWLKLVLTNDYVVEGRNQIVEYLNRKIFIDFAHSEKEVEEYLTFLNKHKINRLICVIGCGGNRDKSKRKPIGKIATNLCDYVVFTEDNSRDESPIDIIDEIISDITKTNYEIVLKRLEAIRKAIKISENGDYIAILGRGSENKLIAKTIENISDYQMIQLCIN